VNGLSKLAYIQFVSDDDAVKAVQILRRDFEIAIEENVFCVPQESLAVLDKGSICYTVANYPAWTSINRRSWRILRDVAAPQAG